MFDGYIVVYKFIGDLHFYVTGGDDENELILVTVLQAFFDAVSLLLRYDLCDGPTCLFRDEVQFVWRGIEQVSCLAPAVWQVLCQPG